MVGIWSWQMDLHYDLVEFTTSIADKPFVVHGGSGLSNRVLLRLIDIPGVKKINISTDIKLAYYNGIHDVYRQMRINGFQPTKANQLIYKSIIDVTISKMKLLGEGNL